MPIWAGFIAGALVMTGLGLISPAVAAAPPAAAAVSEGGEPGSFVSLAPSRVLDTRTGNGASGPVVSDETIRVQVTGRGGVPSSGVSAVVLNVTVAGASAAGFVTAYPDGTARPTASNLNFPAGDTRANLVTVQVGSNGRVALTNSSAGSAHLIADVAGYYVGGAVGKPGSFVSLAPSRVLDTRYGVGAGVSGPVTANETIWVQVTGRAGVPLSGVSAVVLNVTVTGASESGFVTVYPPGTDRPMASNLNFPAGDTRANLTTVRVGPEGMVALTNSSAGVAHLIADVAGYYVEGRVAAPGAFVSLTATRVLDTRSGGVTSEPVAANGTISLRIAGRGGVPSSGVTAVVVNVTVTGASEHGFITVYPGGTSPPAASNVNFPAGDTRANLVTVKLGASGEIAFTNSSARSVHVIADVSGYFSDGTPGAWSSPQSIDPRRGQPQAVSCATRSFCAAGDVWGAVMTFDGSSWSEPVAPPRQGRSITSLSCPDPSFCVGVDSSARALVFDGAAWSAPAAVLTPDLSLSSVSCPSSTFCAAVGSAGSAAIFDGTTWSAVLLDLAHANAVSCATTTFCTAVHGDGGVSMFVDGGWSTQPGAIPIPEDGWVLSVSCPTTSFCAAVTNQGDVATFDGETWSFPRGVSATGGTVWTISCSSDVSCIGLSDSLMISFDGTHWTDQAVAAAPSPSLSCVSAEFCVRVSDNGSASEFDGLGWSQPVEIDPRRGGLSHLSCPLATFCVAVDASGYAFTFDGESWSQGVQVDVTRPGPRAVSCASESFCVATNEWVDGHVSVFDGSEWSSAVGLSAYPLRDVSCPTTIFCMAIDQFGGLSTFDGGRWSTGDRILPDGYPAVTSVIDCVTETFCAAVTDDGSAITFDGTSWSYPVPLDVTEGFWEYDVSCTSQTFCVAVDTFSEAYVFDGSAWSGAMTVSQEFGFDDVSCAAEGSCVAVTSTAFGNVLASTFDGSSWSDAEVIATDVFGETGLSCATPIFCGAVFGDGDAMIGRFSG